MSISKNNVDIETQADLDKIKNSILELQTANLDQPAESDSPPENLNINAEGGGASIKRKKPSAGGLSDPYNAQYPYNHSHATESGHLIEYDDTPNHERINIQHRSGAYIEIHPDGHIVIAANKLHQQGTELHIGIEGNASLDIGGDMRASVGGSAYVGAREEVAIESIGDVSVKTEGRTNIKSTGVVSLLSLSDCYIQADASVTLAASGNINATTQNILNLKGKEVNIKSTSKMNIHAGSEMDLNSTSGMTLYGSTIKMNDTGASAATISPIPSAEFSDSELEIFKTELGEMEFDFDFPLPQYTAIGPNGETSRSTQAITMASNLGQTSGAASVYRGEGNIYIPETPEVSVIQPRGEGTNAGQVEYRISGKIRNTKIVADLENILMSAAKKVNVDVIIFSGGQVAKSSPNARNGINRTGSVRHDNGYGVDVYLYTREFKYQYRTDRPETHTDTAKVKAFISACKDIAGDKLSAGAGAKYMSGTGIHLDIAAGVNVSEQAAKHWGMDGRSKYSPRWLSGIFA